MMRKTTKDMTNKERVYFLDSHVKAISAPLEMFRKASASGHGDEK